MKIEIRTYCKICGTKITKRRFRTYCSTECMKERNKRKQKEKISLNRKAYNQYQRDRLERKRKNKQTVKCLICGKRFVQVGTHVVQRHGITAREYREYFDLEVKRGTVPPWYRKLKGDIAIENKTYKNLEIGKKFWFKKGDTTGRYKRSHITINRLKELHNKGGK